MLMLEEGNYSIGLERQLELLSQPEASYSQLEDETDASSMLVIFDLDLYHTDSRGKETLQHLKTRAK